MTRENEKQFYGENQMYAKQNIFDRGTYTTTCMIRVNSYTHLKNMINSNVIKQSGKYIYLKHSY